MTPAAPEGTAWWLAVAVPLGFGTLALALGWVRGSGFLLGIPLGVFVLRTGGWPAFAILTAFFLLGTGLTRLGYARKAARGLAEGNLGRRGARHVVANAAVGMGLLALRAAWPGGPTGDASVLLAVAFAGAFAAAASDTASSEIGQLWGRRTISPWTGRPLAPGTPGGISLAGTAAGLGAAALMAAIATSVGWVDSRGALAVCAGGFLGNWLESLSSAARRRALPHDVLNLANTAVGAGIAAALRAL